MRTKCRTIFSPALVVSSIVLTLTVVLLSGVAQAQGTGITFKWKSFIWPGSIEDLLLSILNIFIVIATPIVVLFIIYAGFLYVTAQGNAQQVQQATRALSYSIIGGIIIIGAVAIAGIVSGVVGSFTAP